MRGICDGGHLDLAKYLLEIQSDHRFDSEGCLRNACEANQAELVKLMIDQDAKMINWALEGAYQTGAIDACRYLISICTQNLCSRILLQKSSHSGFARENLEDMIRYHDGVEEFYHTFS